jgi:hypothetical protein
MVKVFFPWRLMLIASITLSVLGTLFVNLFF